jgi:hypothetical protein
VKCLLPLTDLTKTGISPQILVKHANNNVGFEVFTEVVMKSIIFWDVTPCSLLRCNRRFGGIYRLRAWLLLARWFSPLVLTTSSDQPMGTELQFPLTLFPIYTPVFRLAVSSACHLLTCRKIFLDPEDGADIFLRNVGWISTDYTTSHPRRWYSSNNKFYKNPLRGSSVVSREHRDWYEEPYRRIIWNLKGANSQWGQRITLIQSRVC